MRYSMRLWLVECVSLSRLGAALLFASLAFQKVPLWLIAGIYLFAMCSDLLDGYMARRLTATTYFGKIVDLVSDKSLSMVSLLYAASRGVPVLPLALIAAREIIMIGGRIIVIDEQQLLPTSKIFGGISALLLWGNTLLLVITQDTYRQEINRIYWVSALTLSTNLVWRIYVSGPRIKAALKR